MSSPPPTPGIHHVTCIASDPQQNLDFWAKTLGLRLVKQSINQDDPTTYHFFFADSEGTPGTSMTFFPWEDLQQGQVGTGQVSRTAFRVPEGSLDFWEDRFEAFGVDYEDRRKRFGETVLPFYDPDGLPVELVAVDIPTDDPTVPWTEFVPDDAAIRGFHSVTLWLADPQRTEDVLRTMGLDETVSEELPADSRGEERARFAATGTVGQYVDVVSTTTTARQGHGTVHHVAFQTPSDTDQSAIRNAVEEVGVRPTNQIDRHWFRSVYFREPNGVLFELATSGPGYASDEPLEALGGELILPGEFENQRGQIEAGLADVTVPSDSEGDADADAD